MVVFRTAPSFFLACLLAAPVAAHSVPDPPGSKPVIQIALLLDTSNSMDGLINQAKAHLWLVVNELAMQKQDGRTARIEVALFKYGNNGLPAAAGYIRRVFSLTTALDAVSEALFGLTTNGGQEFCGQVINEATRSLSWTRSKRHYRAIFIAGNEPFTQGPVNDVEACRAAIASRIIVNTIHCGSYDQGVAGMWQRGAQLADGKYVNIDQNQVVVDIEAPQDDDLARLNAELNATYLWFGDDREESASRQLAQDVNAASVAAETIAQRVAAKSRPAYDYRHRDLVDAVRHGTIRLVELADEHLPEVMRKMRPKERATHVHRQTKLRAELQKQIQQLARARDAHVAEQRHRLAADSLGSTLGGAIISAVRSQTQRSGFE